MQIAKNIYATLGNSPREMVLSIGRVFATTQILLNTLCIGLLVLLYPIIYYLPRAFPTRSADFFIFYMGNNQLSFKRKNYMHVTEEIL